MTDIKTWINSETVLGGLVILGAGVLAMKKILNAFGWDVIRKNGSGTCKDHGKVCQALSTGEERFQEIDKKLDDMPLKIITLLKDTKGLL